MNEKKAKQNESVIITTLRNLTKTNVWELSESEVVALLENAARDIEIAPQLSKIEAIIKTAFDVETVKKSSEETISALEKRGYSVHFIKITNNITLHWGLKKKSIHRVTDLTYENIHHISAEQLLELIENNFGGGWESLSLSIKDIILSGFNIATTSMPKSRVVTKSGLYGKKIAEGFSVLELEKGTWVDLIFAKAKEEAPKPHREELNDAKRSFDDDDYSDDDDMDNDYENQDDSYANSGYDDDDEYDEEKLTEESYLTVTDEDPDTLDIADVEEDEEDF